MSNTGPDRRDFEERFKACSIDFLLKTSTGVIIGGLFGSFFLRGNKWPILICGGLGLGMAYSNCESSLNNYIKSTETICQTKKGI